MSITYQTVVYPSPENYPDATNDDFNENQTKVAASVTKTLGLKPGWKPMAEFLASLRMISIEMARG